MPSFSLKDYHSKSGIQKGRCNFFALLFMGRTGSTFVVDVYDQHPDVLFVGEALKNFGALPDSDARQEEWLRELWSTENGEKYKAIGFKTKPFDIPDKTGFIRMLDEFRPTILILRRANLLKQAISVQRIEQRAESIKQDIGEEKWAKAQVKNSTWNVFDPKQALARSRVDLEWLDGLLSWLKPATTEFYDFARELDENHGLDVVYMDYDDLLLDQSAFFEMSFHVLGVSPFQFKQRVHKYTSDRLRTAIENYEELSEHYKGTEYEHFLDD